MEISIILPWKILRHIKYLHHGIGVMNDQITRDNKPMKTRKKLEHTAILSPKSTTIFEANH